MIIQMFLVFIAISFCRILIIYLLLESKEKGAMQGKIIKGIAGFYYVYAENHGLYECKAKGIFRNQNIKPLVGDNVLIEVLNQENKKGSIIDILDRKNTLTR